MIIDPNISLGSIITIVLGIITAVGFVWMVKADARVLAESLKIQTTAAERRFAELEEKLDKLSSVVVALAKQDGRLNIVDDRMLAQGKRIDEVFKAINNNTLIDRVALLERWAIRLNDKVPVNFNMMRGHDMTV